MDSITSVLNTTEDYIERENYKGYDPYDALHSPLMTIWPFRDLRTVRWGFQQVLKRLPFQTRPIFGIPKGYNPVTLGLALQAYTYRSAATNTGNAYMKRIVHLISELERKKSQGYSGACWGYDFDWEAKHASIPAFCPTVVATGFITHALYECYRIHKVDEAAKLVVESVPFLLNDIPRTESTNGFCWSYSPLDKNAVLNATMKGARLCSEAASITGDQSLFDLSAQTISYVADRQRPDGAWPYSVSDSRSWVDNFHTCYILDSLDEYERLSGDCQFNDTKRIGLEYYLNNFFESDGSARYYDKAKGPVDSTACAQSIITLLRFGEIEQAKRTVAWCLDNMAMKDGSFAYQKRGNRLNKIKYMRWSTAWFFLALSRFELDLAVNGSSDPTAINRHL